MLGSDGTILSDISHQTPDVVRDADDDVAGIAVPTACLVDAAQIV